MHGSVASLAHVTKSLVQNHERGDNLFMVNLKFSLKISAVNGRFHNLDTKTFLIRCKRDD